VLSTVDADLTIPDGIRFAFVSVRSSASAVTVTLPLIAACPGAAILFSCPDGAANAVTITAAAGNTALTGASVSAAADNLIVLLAVPGTTDWQGHVGT
jgi:ABC-type transport system involved in cytochrome c biogenesis permease component